MCGFRCMCVCPFDWTHMCSPAVLGLQEHLKTTFNPACPALHTHKHTHAHTQSTADREQVQLFLLLQYCVCMCVYMCLCVREGVRCLLLCLSFYVITVNCLFFPCKFTFVICLSVLSCALLKTQM